VQIIIALVVTPEGLPLTYEVLPGNTADKTDQEKVAALATSIKAIGLRTPISVRILPKMTINGIDESNVPVLVAGLHRLEAVKSLGIARIEGVVQHGSDLDARMREIAENLHRVELSALERADHIAEWIKLLEERGLQSGAGCPD
jgi:ParB/RepB/Spo0J family partition protein